MISNSSENLHNILEYIDVEYDRSTFIDIFEKLTESNFRGYANCGTISKIIDNTPNIKILAKNILEKHNIFDNAYYDPMATGFNFAPEIDKGIPPHCDWGDRNYYNLLLPIYGVAEITVYHTNNNVVNRWNMTPDERKQWYDPTGEHKHWSMKLSPETKLTPIGKLIIDKPVLLDTNYLHNVKIIQAPRLNWVTRWMKIDTSITFEKAKEIIQRKLSCTST